MSNLSVWDLDGTLRPGSLLAEGIQHGVEAGFIDQTRFADPAHPTYEEARYFVDAVTHQPRKVFHDLEDRLSDEAREHCFDWSLAELNSQAHPIILSHSPFFLVRAFGRGLNVPYATGSFYHTSNGIFSGHAVLRDKPRTLRRYMRERDLQHIAFAAGDSDADIPLLERAERAVVVNPYPPLAELAIERHWEILSLEKTD